MDNDLDDLNELREMIAALTDDELQQLAQHTIISLAAGEIGEGQAELISALIFERKMPEIFAVFEKESATVN